MWPQAFTGHRPEGNSLVGRGSRRALIPLVWLHLRRRDQGSAGASPHQRGRISSVEGLSRQALTNVVVPKQAFEAVVLTESAALAGPAVQRAHFLRACRRRFANSPDKPIPGQGRKPGHSTRFRSGGKCISLLLPCSQHLSAARHPSPSPLFTGSRE